MFACDYVFGTLCRVCHLLDSFALTLNSRCSIPFNAEDIDIAIPAIDPDDIDLPAFLSEYPCAQFLISHQK